MRIILINPPIDSVIEKGNVNPVTQYLFYNSAPLGILYIAAVLDVAAAGHCTFTADALPCVSEACVEDPCLCGRARR